MSKRPTTHYLKTLNVRSRSVIANDLRVVLSILHELEKPTPSAEILSLTSDHGSRSIQATSPKTGRKSSQRKGKTEIPKAPFRSILAFDWGTVPAQKYSILTLYLENAYAPASARRMLAAIRGVLKATYEQNYKAVTDYQACLRALVLESHASTPTRVLTPEIFERLLDVCGAKTPAGQRDAVLFVLMYCVGLTRSECVLLPHNAYDRASHGVKVPRSILRASTLKKRERTKRQAEAREVGGQVGKQADDAVNEEERVIPERYAGLVERWLESRGSEPGPMLLPVFKSGRICGDRTLGHQAVMDIVLRRAEQIGENDISPQDFRRAFLHQQSQPQSLSREVSS